MPNAITVTRPSSFAVLAIYMSHAAKTILGFSALLAVVLATDYPAYNVLAFSEKCGERALSQYAHDAFKQGFFLLLFSIVFSTVCIAVIPAGVMALKADHEYTREKLTKLYNSRIRNSIVTILFILSFSLAYAGWDRAASFFDNGIPPKVLQLGSVSERH